MEKALITGITGQDGSYLAEFLLEKGYEVHGIVRRVGVENLDHRFSRINHIKDKIKLHSGSIESYSRLLEIFEDIKPDECYHLAAQSFVQESFEDSFSTLNTNISGTHNALSALQRKTPSCKFYFAASSEMFGKVEEVPQTEDTKFHPRSPYGISKVTGFELTRNCREAYNTFACSGILFNHESPRRGLEFVTRKITHKVAQISLHKDNVLVLGNLNAKRDWGFAGDYVKAMWLMLQQKTPSDYVIAIGKYNSVKEFVDLAFNIVGINYELVDLNNLSAEEANLEVKKLRSQKSRYNYVIQHPEFYRPSEVNELLGDASKAKKFLGWRPEIDLEKLVKMMVSEDIKSQSDIPVSSDN